MDLEKKIKQTLRDNNLTITDLVKNIDMSYSGFYDTMKRKTLKVSTLEKIAEFLKVDMTFFFVNEVENKENQKLSEMLKKIKKENTEIKEKYIKVLEQLNDCRKKENPE